MIFIIIQWIGGRYRTERISELIVTGRRRKTYGHPHAKPTAMRPDRFGPQETTRGPELCTYCDCIVPKLCRKKIRAWHIARRDEKAESKPKHHEHASRYRQWYCDSKREKVHPFRTPIQI